MLRSRRFGFSIEHAVLLILPVMLFIVQNTNADTNVGGTISADTHWTTDGRSYIVQNDIAVIDGATLTIDPGV